MAFFDFLRPKGVRAIELSETLDTHVKFGWNGGTAIIVLNRPIFEKLSPAVRYFVLMHEIGHIKTMDVFTNQASQIDEQKASEYALEECAKVGFYFGNVREAHAQFDHEISI